MEAYPTRLFRWRGMVLEYDENNGIGFSGSIHAAQATAV